MNLQGVFGYESPSEIVIPLLTWETIPSNGIITSAAQLSGIQGVSGNSHLLIKKIQKKSQKLKYSIVSQLWE